jgi:hypothetical protein
MSMTERLTRWYVPPARIIGTSSAHAPQMRPAEPEQDAPIQVSAKRNKLTRRQILGYGAGAVVAGASAGRLLIGEGRIRFDLTPRRAAVLLDGERRWIVDKAHYHGRASLRYTQAWNYVNITLKSAFFPGSTVPADFAANCRLGGGRWRLTLHSALSGESLSVDLIDWLEDRAALTLTSALARSFRLTGGGSLSIPERTRLEWRANAPLSWRSEKLIELRHAGFLTRGRDLSTGLGAAQSESAISARWLKRAVWQLKDGTVRRCSESQTFNLADRRLRLLSSARATLAVETGETQLGATFSYTLESEAEASFASATYKRFNDGPAEILLGDFRYVRTQVANTTETRAAASPKTTWIHAEDASFLVSGCEGAAGFIAESGTKISPSSSCSVDVLQIVLHMPGFDSAVFTKQLDALGKSRADLSSLTDARRPHSVRLDDFRLHAERMSDQLALDFEFANMALSRLHGSWQIEAVDANPPLLRALFSPQHLQERAYFYQGTTEQVPIDAGDPKWQVCPPNTPTCPNPYDPPTSWKRLLDLAYAKQAPIGSFEFVQADRDTPVTKARLSGTSRLVFALPTVDAPNRPRALPAPASAHLLLNWKDYEPRLSARALVANPDLAAGKSADYIAAVNAILAPPAADESAIEFPTDLVLSADKSSRWLTAIAAPSEQEKPHELWHAQLQGSSVRALWATGFNPDYFPNAQTARPSGHHPPLPSHNGDATNRMPMDTRDRHELVALTSVFGLEALRGTANVIANPGSAPVRRCSNSTPDGSLSVFLPQPVTVNHLSLSALGATARLKGNWDPPSDDDASNCWDALTVEEWQQIANLGRDTYVRVVYKGFLLPIGIRASLVKLTERVMVRDIWDSATPETGGKRMKAVLRQRMFIVIGRPQKPFPALGQPDAGRDWPFDQIEFTTLVTPDIEDPFKAAVASYDPDLNALLPQRGAAFWPRISKNQFVDFHFDAIKDGNRTSLISALLFVDNTTVHNPGTLANILDYYDCKLAAATPVYDPAKATPATAINRRVLVGGSRLAYAASRKPGDTQFETSIFTMMARRRGAGSGADANADLRFTAALEAESQPPFYPSLDTALVRVEAIRRLSAQSVDEVSVRFDRQYLRDGFSSGNSGEVFLLLTQDNVRLNVAGNSSSAGGVATPNTLVVGLSRRTGLIGGSKVASASSLFQCTNAGVRAGALRALGTDPVEDPDPALDSVRQGTFDPESYFGAVLGDAKLLGMIRLVDVIKAALKVLDLDSAPQLLEQYTFALSAQVIAQLQLALLGDARKKGPLLNLRDLLAAANQQASGPAVTRLLKQLDIVIADTQALRAPADTNDTSSIAACTALVLAARTFLSQLDAISRNPSSLLPEALTGFLTQLNGILGAVKSGDLNSLIGIVDSIKVNSEPYLTIKAALAPVRAPFEAALQRATQVRNDIKAQVDAGVDQLLDALYPILSEVFSRYCELIDEGQCFSEGVAALQQADLTQLTQALQTLSEVNAKAIDALDAAVALIDATIRSWFDPKTVSTYATLLQPIASQLSAAGEGVRARLVALRDQIDASAKKSGQRTLNDVLGALGAQGQLIATVQLMETLVANASNAAQALPHQPTPQNGGDLYADFANLSQALKTAAINCSDAYTMTTGVNTSMGLALDQVFIQLQTLLNAGGLATINAKMAQAYAAEVQTAAAIKAAGSTVSTSLLAAYFDYREQFIWAAALVTTAKGCFAGQACTALDLFPKLRTQVESLLQTLGTAIVTPIKAMVDWVNANDSLPNRRTSLLGPNLLKAITDLDAAIHAYNLVQDYWTQRAKALQAVLIQARAVVDTIHSAIEHGSVTSLVNVSEIAKEALSSLPLPTHLTLSYDWSTPLGAFPSGSPTFAPIDEDGKEGDDGLLTLSARVEVDLLNSVPAKSTVSGSIKPFRLYLLNKDESLDFFHLDITKLEFASAPGTSSQYTVVIGNVKLGQAFQFIDALGGLFGDSGDDNGFYSLISLDPPAIEVGYRYGFDILSLGEFSILNLRLALGFRLPFDNTPARLSFAVSTKEKPCLIVATPYGGGFFFGMVARAGGGIESLEGAFEFGAMTAFKFGPLSGAGRVAAGFYFASGPGGSTICGYVVAYGEATIAWFSLSVLLTVSVCSAQGNVEGQADFTVTFRVSSFFKISFGFTAAYRFAGSGAKHSVAGPASPHLAGPVNKCTDKCPYPSPSTPPPRCPPNITRKLLEDRFLQRRQYLGDLS